MLTIGAPSRRWRGRLALVVGAVVAGMIVPATAAARPNSNACERRNNNQYDKLLECVTVAGVREHLAALQAIANANGGTRAEQTAGYTESVEYVVDTMTAAGWAVERVPFEYEVAVAELEQLTPVHADYETGGFLGSGFAAVPNAPVVPVDVKLVPPRASTSGCEGAFTQGAATTDPIVADPGGPDDFAGFAPGAIALLQRGTCTFALKAYNAQAAGASAVVIFNQGNTPDREGLIVANAVAPNEDELGPLTIPVVGASFADGSALAQPGSTARASTRIEDRTSENVIAEKLGANAHNVVMAGAHLDSVPAGPGINDNGSGSATLLEIAQNLGRHTPRNTLRFAWWGAEELGLIGSTEWVATRSQPDLDEIALYLNFDMVGSPNHFIGVYDADQSSYEAPVDVPDGSTAIEDVFESYFTMVNEPYDDTEFSGRSDYQAFINNQIPSSGLFTGAEVPKTAAQQAVWGGTVGAAFDPCYHAACDTTANINDHALDVNSDAIAFAVLTFAYSTESVNGVPGQRVPGSRTLPTPAGPIGTCPAGPDVECAFATGP
jgi:Zn-dependent M28 family amino/carboxypeptidase